MIGIYQIKNIENNKCYIGLSTNIEDRFLFHKRRLAQGKHKNKHLQSSFNNHGPESFKFAILEECNKSMLSVRERYWITKFESYKRTNGYNKTHGGEFGRLSDEIIQSTANKLRGRTLSNEMKKRISKTLTGKKQPQLVIEKRSKSIRKCSEEVENQIIKLFSDRLLLVQDIAKLLEIKQSTVHSILKRYKIKRGKWAARKRRKEK